MEKRSAFWMPHQKWEDPIKRVRRTRGAFFLSIAGICACVPMREVAQQPPAQNPACARITADTGTVEEGREAGKVAAGKRRTENRLTMGYVGGLSIAVLGPRVFLDEPIGPIGLGTGLVVIGAAWRLGDTRPPETQSISECGEAYRRAYSESYEKRLRERWGKAALFGGVVGIAAGLLIRLAVGPLIGTGIE